MVCEQRTHIKIAAKFVRYIVYTAQRTTKNKTNTPVYYKRVNILIIATLKVE
jgi:hypothetical protein